MKYDAILFDFDGVLIESESAGNRHLAGYLTAIGHPITAEDSMAAYMGLAGSAFTDAIEATIGRPLPADFWAIRQAEAARALAEGIGAVTGAIAFVESLPADLPIAIVSSSGTDWITTHLDHIGLRARFGTHVYSGHEHVARGKPAPDIYLYGAHQLGVAIERCVILEDSPVGATGAVASGADVIGLCVADHIGAGHADRLRALGVRIIADDFDEVAAIIR